MVPSVSRNGGVPCVWVQPGQGDGHDAGQVGTATLLCSPGVHHGRRRNRRTRHHLGEVAMASTADRSDPVAASTSPGSPPSGTANGAGRRRPRTANSSTRVTSPTGGPPTTGHPGTPSTSTSTPTPRASSMSPTRPPTLPRTTSTAGSTSPGSPSARSRTTVSTRISARSPRVWTVPAHTVRGRCGPGQRLARRPHPRQAAGLGPPGKPMSAGTWALRLLPLPVVVLVLLLWRRRRRLNATTSASPLRRTAVGGRRQRS